MFRKLIIRKSGLNLFPQKDFFLFFYYMTLKKNDFVSKKRNKKRERMAFIQISPLLKSLTTFFWILHKKKKKEAFQSKSPDVKLHPKWRSFHQNCPCYANHCWSSGPYVAGFMSGFPIIRDWGDANERNKNLKRKYFNPSVGSGMLPTSPIADKLDNQHSSRSSR